MFETLGFTVAEFERFLLVAVRIITLVNLLPIISSPSIDIKVRVMFGMFLSMIIAPIIPVPEDLPVTFIWLIPYAIKEILIGLLLGTVSKVLFEALNFAGSQVSRMMNLSMVSLIDPASSDKTNAIGQMYYFIAMLLLFVTNGHHFFIQAIFDSFYHIPLTKVVFHANLVTQLINVTSSIFIIGLKVGAPIFGILFLQRVLLALIIFEIYKNDLIIFMKLLGNA